MEILFTRILEALILPPGGPLLLTILGIILFLRLGFVVGSAGLNRALLILLFANGISILTTFSLSTISTNIRVKGGGDYYLIRRDCLRHPNKENSLRADMRQIQRTPLIF